MSEERPRLGIGENLAGFLQREQGVFVGALLARNHNYGSYRLFLGVLGGETCLCKIDRSHVRVVETIHARRILDRQPDKSESVPRHRGQ